MTTAKGQQGELSGQREGSVTLFLGVPFAAPPVGDLRWKSPRPAASWSGTRKAETLPTYGAFHSCEIPYVFNMLGASSERPVTDLDRRLAQSMGDYWVDFVQTGDPNGSGLPVWRAYLSEDRKILEIGEAVSDGPTLPEVLREFFERHVVLGGRLSLFSVDVVPPRQT